MAYFEQRKAGWLAQIRRKGSPTLSRTFDLKTDAEAWAREVERELQRGNVRALDTSAQRTMVSEVAARYRASAMPRMKKKVDVANAESRLRVVEARFGKLFLAAIRPLDVAAWRDELSAKYKYAPQTVIHHMNMLSGLYRFAQNELGMDLPLGNPVRGVPKPAQPRGRTRRLRGDEYAYLLKSAAAARVAAVGQLIILAVETSMRLGELLALEWKHIDLRKRTAHLVDTKNGESRTVALSNAALDALRALPRRIDGRVFGWEYHTSVAPVWQRCVTRAQRLYVADCAASGTKPDPSFLADLRFHDLRHEATSRLFEKGLGIMEVASMTGHKSLAMLKRYTHVEAEKLAAKLG